MGRPVAGNRMRAGLRRRRAGPQAGAEDSSDEDDDMVGRAGRPGRGGGAEEDDEDEEEVEAVAKFSKRDAYDARRAARDAEREALEAAQEAEIRRAAEERVRKEEAEAAKWMHTFSVEAAGEDALSQEQGEALLSRMADYIQRRKMVALEELAAEFGIRTTDAVERVQELEAGGLITGVMDDRGKYIHVSREEMAAVADFIRRQGRVPIAELAAKSSGFIDLTPKAVLAEGEALLPELP